MIPAHIVRLLAFAQHGQPADYMTSNMMREDLEVLIMSATSPGGPPLRASAQEESMPIMGGRESINDALDVVESFGSSITGLNDTYARQVILAKEVRRLRALLMAVLKKTA